MGLEKYALDAHKSFVKEHLVKVSFLLYTVFTLS